MTSLCNMCDRPQEDFDFQAMFRKFNKEDIKPVRGREEGGGRQE